MLSQKGLSPRNKKEFSKIVLQIFDETTYSKTFFNVLALAVSKENVGQGIGKKLMSVLESETHTRGQGYGGICLIQK